VEASMALALALSFGACYPYPFNDSTLRRACHNRT
jgi:hypothetical protein